MNSGIYLTIEERKMHKYKRRNVRLFGFQLERFKIHRFIMHYCFFTFTISVNCGADWNLYHLYILWSEMNQNNTVYSNFYSKSCPKIKLATLIWREFLIPGHVKVESGSSFILQSKKMNTWRIHIIIKKKRRDTRKS